MRGIIWYDKKAKGQIKLEEIIKSYKNMNIPIKKQSKSVSSKNYVLFENGDLWNLLPANEYCRGFRVNISYIDENIEEEFIHSVIDHSTTAMPYQGIMYY